MHQSGWKKRSFSLLLVLAMLLTLLPATALAVSQVNYPTAPEGYDSLAAYKRNSLGIHDTEYYYDSEESVWYAYWTNSSTVAKSDDLLTWTNVGNRGGNGWAPCFIELTTPITYNETEYSYAAYDASSGFGTRDSSIRLWLSNSPYEGFVNAGDAIVSRADDEYDFNAIDPKAFYDKDGKLWMSYGSWFGGIYIVELDPTTGKPAEGALPGKRVCYRNINHADIEGSTVIYNPDTGYYYLNVSYGDMDNTYNVRIGRSENPDGPYLDYNGQDLNNTTIPVSQNYNVGTKITTPYTFEFESGWYSTGHSSFLFDGENYYLSTNARGDDVSGTKMQIRKIYWTADGWPVVGPEMYVPGEDVATGVTAEELEGAYQVITLLRQELEATTAGCRRSNETIVLTADGKVTGSKTGTWSLDGTTLTLTLDDVVYTTTVLAVWDWENWNATLAFTGLSKANAAAGDTDGIQLWGKQVDAQKMVDESASALTLPASIRTNLVMPQAKYTGVSITWTSDRPEVLSNDGVVTRPEGEAVTVK